MRRLASGDRERHLRAGRDAISVPGPYSGSLVGHYDPARSDHGQTPKGKDAALARRKARGVTLHAQSPAIRARPRATHSRAGPGELIKRTWIMRLVGAPSPSPEGERKTGIRATLWPKDANRGRSSFDFRRFH